MSNKYDVIIIGLGGMGSQAAGQLAARGQRVLGLEQFTPAHAKGSSHGKTRVIRQAYFEHPSYVPLLVRAYELWRDLEKASGQELLTITGGLMLGLPGSEVVAGTLASVKQFNLPHEVLDASQIRQRFSPFNPTPETVGVYETMAGVVRPEKTVSAALGRAERAGAALHFEEPVIKWEAAPSGDSVCVTTTRGTYEAAQLVISAGAWAGPLLADLGIPLHVERRVLYWLESSIGIDPYLPDRFPIWIWETEEAWMPYGFPAHDGPHGGVKVAPHHRDPTTVCTPETIDRTVHASEIEQMRTCMAKYLPSLAGKCLETATCMYTLTPDGHFVIDRHPQHSQVLIVSPCSGHGFKFTPVVGEIVADLITTGKSRNNIELFQLSRLLKK